MLGKVLDFLFGKNPDIFDKDGTIRHNLPKERWEEWRKRFQAGEEYNWRNHTGVRGGGPNSTGSGRGDKNKH